MKIDTHLHLDEPWLTDVKIRQITIDDISKNKIVTWAQSCSVPSFEKTLEYSRQSEYIFPSFGILPWYANEYMDKLHDVARMCKDALMLGEIGLDVKSTRNESTREEQNALFEVFLESAEKHNMIMNCHFRGGIERDGLEVLKSYKVKKAIFHHYSGPPEMIDEITENGFYISYGSPSYRNMSKEMKEYLAARIPKVHQDFLIIEIDVLGRGKSFRPPSEIYPAILKPIAKMRNTTIDEIESLNHKNVLRLIDNDPRLKDMVDLLG
ncbi:MAG: TatD family hydrolase [Candidatus Thorarchaeota archaeon]